MRRNVVLAVQLLFCTTRALASPIDNASSNLEITTSPLLAPIFRETPSREEPGVSSSRVNENASDGAPDELDRPAYQDMASASVEIELDQSNRQFVEQGSEILAGKSAVSALPADERERYELLLALNLVQAKIAGTLGPYRGHMSADAEGQRPAIRLGETWRPQEPLGANINNYAPDNFADADVMRLFAMHREVHELLARDAATGECHLFVSELRALNREVLDSFKRALLGYAPAVENSPMAELEDEQVPADDQEECAICRESLASEQSARLSCGHVYHKACLASWARVQETPVNTCPRCREIFRLPYRMVEELTNRGFIG